MVIADGNGLCALLDVATDESLFSLKLGEKGSSVSQILNPD